MTLPDNLSEAAFNKDLADVVRRYKPRENYNEGMLLLPLKDMHYDTRFNTFHNHPFSRALIRTLSLIGLFVLLIACANVANLLLARATSRQKEMAIRTALGARRSRIIMQLLTESMLLALTGGIVGLFVAMWAADALVALQPRGIPRLDEIGIDTRVLGFTLGVSVVTGILFGLAPAIQISKPDVAAAIKEAKALPGDEQGA